MYAYTVPDECIRFVHSQFNRFSAPVPSPNSINTIAEIVIRYVIKNNYWPQTGEAELRFEKVVPLNHLEKVQFIGHAEVVLKINRKEIITIDQIHLAAWASLLWIWSQEGVKYASWCKTSAVVA